MSPKPDPLREKVRDLISKGYEVRFSALPSAPGTLITLLLEFENGVGLETQQALPWDLIDRDNRSFPVADTLTVMERRIKEKLA